jgi:hypothetical protein
MRCKNCGSFNVSYLCKKDGFDFYKCKDCGFKFCGNILGTNSNFCKLDIPKKEGYL